MRYLRFPTVGLLLVLAGALSCTERLKESAYTEEGRGAGRTAPPPLSASYDEAEGEPEETAEAPAPAAAETEEGEAATEAFAAAEAPTSGRSFEDEFAAYREGEGTDATPETSDADATKKEEPREVALGRKLHAQLGGAGPACLTDDVRTSNPGEVSIFVAATVSAAGRVTSATASGPLPGSALECIRGRALATSFPEAEDDEIANVSTTLTFNVTPPKRVERTVYKINGVVVGEVKDGKLPDAPPPFVGATAVPPASALPARAQTASMGVPAATTLPARVGEGPAPGAAAPSATLPARATP